MIKLQTNGTITFSIFDNFSELVCFQSTKQSGDLKVKNSPFFKEQLFLTPLGLTSENLVLMEQVHGKLVENVELKNGRTRIPSVDGLLTFDKETYLGVKTADCVSLFFYDPIRHITAVAHAGWKGTLANISGVILERMKQSGAQAKDILVAIGPHIGGCCYNIDETRARLFRQEFTGDPLVVWRNEEIYYLDIGQANKKQLLAGGIVPKNIDATVVCTSCDNEHYFSYRKDGQTFGRMLGIIGMRA